MPNHDVIFNFGSAKMWSPAIMTYFSYDKDIWIAVTDYNMYLYLTVLFVSPDEIQGYLGFSTVMPLPQRFPFGRNN